MFILGDECILRVHSHVCMHAFRRVCMDECIKNMILSATLIMATFEGVVQKKSVAERISFFT